MNRTLFLIPTLLTALLVFNCNPVNQRKINDKQGINKDSLKDSTVVMLVANTPAQVYAKPEVPVLCYHRIAEGVKTEYQVSPAAFEGQMKILADSGYHSISPAQLYDYLVYNKALPEKPVMITYDDSRTEHFTIAAPVMEKFGFRGVFFIMTITYNKKNYMTTDQIAQLAKNGHTVGLHSWDHTMVTKYKEEADWQKQVAAPKKKLEKIIGTEVEYWAYPNGIFDKKGAEELSKYFKLSFTLKSQDSIIPLQTIRRMIIPEWTPQGMLKAMHRTYSKK